MVPPLPVGLVGSINKITVLDGDTIHADFQGENVRIRLFGIDAPEAGQSFGELSERNLRLRLADPVVMEVMQSQDRYGRVVGIIYRPSDDRWNSVNLRMVRDGLAYAYVPYFHFGYDESEGPLEFHELDDIGKGLVRAEQHAIRNKNGVWRVGPAGSEKPWDRRNSDPVTRTANFVGRMVRNFFG